MINIQDLQEKKERIEQWKTTIVKSETKLEGLEKEKEMLLESLKKENITEENIDEKISSFEKELEKALNEYNSLEKELEENIM